MLKVLVPLDGSEFSAQVLETVKTTLSPQAHAITLLQVASIPKELERHQDQSWVAQIGYVPSNKTHPTLDRHHSYIEGLWQGYERAILAQLEKAKQMLIQAGFKVETLVCFGEASQKIIAYANYNQMDLIIMATHGRSGMRRVMMGSVAEKVFRSVDAPVILVCPFFRTNVAALSKEEMALTNSQS